MPAMSTDEHPFLSFIGIVDFSQEARWIYTSQTVHELLGFEPEELLGHSSIDLVHPDEMNGVRKLHRDTICADKAAALVYLRMKHKDPFKGFILCSVTRTIVHNVVVGSVSYAGTVPGVKALQRASTAAEITILAPMAERFQTRRWHSDPSPLSPSPEPEVDEDGDLTYNHLPNQSFRTALILNRFSDRNTIEFISNELLIESDVAFGRSFFDFVAKGDETIVKSWIEAVKSWGVNETGQPSDGGFGFGQFLLLVEPRVSLPNPEPGNASRLRNGGKNPRNKTTTRKGNSGVRRPQVKVTGISEKPLLVDAIFSAHSDGVMVIIRRALA